MWISNKSAKMFTLNSTRWYAAAFALRQRMLNFVQNFEYYMMFEVIEPNWQLFESNMDNVSSTFCRHVCRDEILTVFSTLHFFVNLVAFNHICPKM